MWPCNLTGRLSYEGPTSLVVGSNAGCAAIRRENNRVVSISLSGEGGVLWVSKTKRPSFLVETRGEGEYSREFHRKCVTNPASRRCVCSCATQATYYNDDVCAATAVAWETRPISLLTIAIQLKPARDAISSHLSVCTIILFSIIIGRGWVVGSTTWEKKTSF